jgi:hypothetical protein
MKHSKYRFLFFLFLAYSAVGQAQNVSINADGSGGHASALLDVQSTDRGMLIPRMTRIQRNAIASPAQGLMVYQTDGGAGFYFYESGLWKALGSASQFENTYLINSTGSLNTSDAAWGLVPGMAQSITVPAGMTARINILVDVGVITNSTGSSHHSCTDIAIIRDGALLPNAGYKRVTAGSGATNNTNNFYQNPVITGYDVLPAGTYTYNLIAIRTCSGGNTRTALVGGNVSSVLQGSMSISVNFQ